MPPQVHHARRAYSTRADVQARSESGCVDSGANAPTVAGAFPARTTALDLKVGAKKACGVTCRLLRRRLYGCVDTYARPRRRAFDIDGAAPRTFLGKSASAGVARNPLSPDYRLASYNYKAYKSKWAGFRRAVRRNQRVRV